MKRGLDDGYELDDWVLHTRDAHALYEKLGFGPNERVMERNTSSL